MKRLLFLMSSLAVAMAVAVVQVLADPAVLRVLDVVYPAVAIAFPVVVAAAWLHLNGMSFATIERVFAAVARSRDDAYRSRQLAA